MPHLCFVVWEERVSKSHFCFAAGSLWGSANRGRQRETARPKKEKATFLFAAVLASQHHSGPTASHQQQFNPVCSIPTLAKSTSLHLTLWRHQAYLLVASSKIWVPDLLASPPSSETGAPPARRRPRPGWAAVPQNPHSELQLLLLPASATSGYLPSGLSSTDDVRGMELWSP